MTCICFKYCLCFFIDQAYQPHLIKLSTWHYCIHMLTGKSMYMYTNGTCEGYAWRQRNSHAAVGPSQHCLLPWFCTEQATCDRDHAHLIEFAHGCGYYSRVATISFTELQVWLLFEASCYLGCSFYLNKYSMHTINGNVVQQNLLDVLKVWEVLQCFSQGSTCRFIKTALSLTTTEAAYSWRHKTMWPILN